MHSLPNTFRAKISRRTRTAGHVVRMVKDVMKDTHTYLVGNSDGYKPLKTPMHRWQDNIKKRVKDTGVEMRSHITCRTGFRGQNLWSKMVQIS